MSEELNLLRRRFERERLARKQAESIAEMKSRELFVKGQELEKTAKAEQKSRHEIELLLRAFESFTSKLNINEISNYLCRYVDSAISCHAITIYIRKEEGFQILSEKDKPSNNLAIGNTILSSGELFQFKELKHPVVIEDVRNDESVQSFRFSGNACSAMIIPLSFQLGIIGYLIVENNKEGRVFVDSEVRIAQALANEAAIALENAKLFQEVEKLSTTDPLTGLNNRLYFNETAQKLFNLSIRYKRSLSALMLDIDYFKNVNDTYGHDIGDEVLKMVAQTCQGLMRLSDLIARYGGEEFCFLFPETNSDGALIIAEKLRKAIAEMQIEADGRIFSITASLGISECNHDGDSLEQLIKRSDQALYEAKRKGRNRTVLWSHNI